ncbi:type 1 fimbrial protein, partial [Salmonella enterica]|nr:type 1 fimbrial protein [Salmonella enterica]
MSMKKYLAMITGSLLVSSSAMAVSDNTITFQGEVSDETCSVVINGNQAKPVVLLPTVSTKDLSEQGKTAGPITFDIGLSGWICPYISRHLLSLNPLLACCRRYSRG